MELIDEMGDHENIDLAIVWETLDSRHAARGT